MSDFTYSLLGGYSIGYSLSLLLFFLIGVAYNSYNEVKNRDVNSPNTPREFSSKFFVFDNLKRYALTFISIFILFRFYKQITGQELNEFNALIAGYSFDSIIGNGKKVTKFLQFNRKKFNSTKP